MSLPKGNKEEQLSKYNLFANHSAANPTTTKSNQLKSCFKVLLFYSGTSSQTVAHGIG